jgi:hypothetical protein
MCAPLGAKTLKRNEDSLDVITSRGFSSVRVHCMFMDTHALKTLKTTITVRSYTEYLILQNCLHPHTKSVASAPKAPSILTPNPATITRHHVTPAASQPAIDIPSELACFHPGRACDLARDWERRREGVRLLGETLFLGLPGLRLLLLLRAIA